MAKYRPGKRPLWTRLKRYLLAGTLITAPAFISLYVVIALVNIADRWVKSLLPARFYPDSRFFGIPGIGLILLLGLLILIGFLTASWFGKFIVALTDGIFAKTPVLSTLYTTLKQLFHTILGDNTNSFRQVVYVEFPRKGCWSIGFVTGVCPPEAGVVGEEMTYIFVPTTPNPTSGYLIMLPKSEIRISDMTVEQGLRAVVSLGITQ
ncbi:MAG: DUF502 domain-containing protein [Planctomycetaceae bacterium]|nr:DUF502 domain-containing protein [Planctomycetaceae bacterium]